MTTYTNTPHPSFSADLKTKENKFCFELDSRAWSVKIKVVPRLLLKKITTKRLLFKSRLRQVSNYLSRKKKTIKLLISFQTEDIMT